MKLKNFVKLTIKGYKKLLKERVKESEESAKVFQPIPFTQPFVQQQKAPIPIEVVEEEKEEKIEGIELPKRISKRVKLVEKKEEEPKFSLVYPLIPQKPKPNEEVFAYAKIYFDKQNHRFTYELVEPKLSEEMKQILKNVRSLIEERLDVDLTKLKKVEATEYLSQQIDDILSYYGFKLTSKEKRILRYYIERDFLGFGKIEPLMKDPNIEDISCDGVNIPIFVFHRDPRIGSVMTNVVFKNSEELDSFVIRLAQLANKSISVAYPLLDGTLPDGSRVQATLGTDIARRGSNFTIRKFTQSPLTPTHLLNFNSIDEKALAYLWMMVDFGRSILVSGGTASGKTTLLNVLSLFIRPEKKIISIEDTAELHLPHSHWVPSVARTIIAGKPGEVDLFELLRESLRQRPDYIIVGEVRGREAFILFQQMATGHPALATIHAENLQKLSDRLTTEPISLPPSLIGSLDVIVFMNRVRFRENIIRRVTEIIEMIKFDPEKKQPIVNKVFKWNSATDKFETGEKSYVFKKICEQTGLSEKEVLEEYQRRILILQWLKQRNVTDFREIHKIISFYYTYPNRLLSKIMGEL